MMRNKLFGTTIYKLIFKKMIISRACALIPEMSGSPCRQKFLNQFKCTGTDNALLSMFRSDAYGSYRESTRIAGIHIKKILLMRGTNDKEITISMINQIREDLPQCQFKEISASGHSPSTESPQEFNQLIIDFVNN